MTAPNHHEVSHEQRTKLYHGFDSLYDQYPFLSHVVSAWRVEWNERVETMATDGPTLVINPKFFAGLTKLEVAWLIVHEASHIFLGHHLRLEPWMEHKRWNVAADLASNSYLPQPPDGKIKDGFCYPGKAPFMGFPHRRSMEEYYSLLEDMVNGGFCAGDASAGAGEVLPHPSLRSGDAEAIQEATGQWEEMVKKNADGAGELHGMAWQMAGALAPSIIKKDWRQEMREFVSKVARTRFSYQRPNRRFHAYSSYLGYSAILPGKHSRVPGIGAFIIDSSGSMNIADCNIALTEMENILNAFPSCQIDALQCDTRLIEEATKTYRRHDFPLVAEGTWWGRGGTDLTPAFRHVALSGQYSWAMCLTDMDWNVARCPDPGVPTLWLSTGKSASQLQGNNRPTFGRIIGPLA